MVFLLIGKETYLMSVRNYGKFDVIKILWTFPPLKVTITFKWSYGVSLY